MKKETINEGIAFCRKRIGYEQKYIADRMGMKLSTYSKTERNGRIYCDTLIKLSEILEVSTDTLLFGGEPPEFKAPRLLDDFTVREENALKMIRNFPKKKRKAVYEFINQRSENIKI